MQGWCQRSMLYNYKLGILLLEKADGIVTLDFLIMIWHAEWELRREISTLLGVAHYCNIDWKQKETYCSPSRVVLEYLESNHARVLSLRLRPTKLTPFQAPASGPISGRRSVRQIWFVVQRRDRSAAGSCLGCALCRLYTALSGIFLSWLDLENWTINFEVIANKSTRVLHALNHPSTSS